jgi:hypothetical protein
MGRAASGGRANWGGADFELRLGVDLCVDILRGEEAGLAPGAIRHVQPQAPGAIDDLVLEFETGTRWAVQAKAGSSVRVEWNPGRPFGKALRQLYEGVTAGQIDASAESLDRAVLAVDHRAPHSITEFGDWLDQARHHHRWEYFVASATNEREREFASQLPPFLDADAGDTLLAFLKQCHVQRAPPPDEWRSRLRGRLIRAGVPDADTADRILDLALARVEAVFPHGGQETARSRLIVAVNRGLAALAPSARWQALTRRLFSSRTPTIVLELLISHLAADMSICRNSTAIPLLAGRVNVSHFCTGGITWGLNHPESLTSGWPWATFRAIGSQMDGAGNG